MKKSILMSSMFVAAALVSQSAMAEFKVRAGAAITSSYELSGDYITAKSDDYSPINVGLTYAADNGFYVDLAGSSGSGKHDGWAMFGAPSEDFKREDYALIAGKSFLNQNNGIAGTFYGGLKGGKTTLGAQNVQQAFPGFWSSENFETVGVVFGGGVSFPIAQGSAGSVGVNLGLGIMTANWNDTNGYDVDSDTAVGGSFGVSYTFPFTSSFGIVADYKYNAYSYDFGDTTNPFTVKEKISALGASLYAKF
jgi:hypothetical protein